jgi:ectoine hydroxylase-related dioxygenase (phytanoyl-CoA dioxygenase family)
MLSSIRPIPNHDQVETYRQEGYLRFGKLFDPEELSDLRRYIHHLIETIPHGKRPEHLDVPHFEHPYLMKFLTHPAVLDAVEAILGPDITLWSSHFISKPGGDGLPVSWHTDADYWKGRIAPIEVVTVWLAVDRSTRENGCMRVIPRTHLDRLERRYRDLPEGTNVFKTTLEESQLDETRIVDIELEEGECSFHDAWLIHGSLPNHSPHRRCGYTMRYMPSSVVYTPLSGKDTHKVFLVRGVDRSGGKTKYTEIPAGADGQAEIFP